jgi:hypothetical protein
MANGKLSGMVPGFIDRSEVSEKTASLCKLSLPHVPEKGKISIARPAMQIPGMKHEGGEAKKK